MSKYMRLLGAAATVGLLASTPAMAQMHYTYSGHHRWETPEMNNILSARYDNKLETNAAFRQYRMRKECNPIDFVQSLRQDCFASFDQYEPVAAGY
jgi:hypothetical protein